MFAAARRRGALAWAGLALGALVGSPSPPIGPCSLPLALSWP